MIKTHRDGFPRFSALSVRRGDAGHRKACATTSESLGKPSLSVFIIAPWYKPSQPRRQARGGFGILPIHATGDAMSAHHLPFTLDEYRARLTACRGAMGRAGIDILLVSSPENINYLTGYYNVGNAMYQALLAPLDGEPRFVLRKLFFEGVGGVSWITTGVAVPDTESMLDATVAEIEAMAGGLPASVTTAPTCTFRSPSSTACAPGSPRRPWSTPAASSRAGASSSQREKSPSSAKPAPFRCAPWRWASPASAPASPKTTSPAPSTTR